MAISPLTKVVGTVRSVQNEAIKGQIEFLASGVSLDDAIIAPVAVTADLDDNGAFEVDLWPNTAGGRATTYRVTLKGDEMTQKSFGLGDIIVPVSETPVQLTLLTDGPWIVPGKRYVQMTWAEFEALAEPSPDIAYGIVAG